jgi:hypothetical protein
MAGCAPIKRKSGCWGTTSPDIDAIPKHNL